MTFPNPKIILTQFQTYHLLVMYQITRRTMSLMFPILVEEEDILLYLTRRRSTFEIVIYVFILIIPTQIQPSHLQVMSLITRRTIFPTVPILEEEEDVLLYFARRRSIFEIVICVFVLITPIWERQRSPDKFGEKCTFGLSTSSRMTAWE